MNRLTRNLDSFNLVWLLLSFLSSLLPQTQAQSGLGLDVLDPSTPFQQCGISQIRWQGSRGISRVAVVDAQTYLPLYIFLPQAPETFSLTWESINVTAGREVRVVVTDSTQSTSVSETFTIQTSNADDCLSSSQDSSLPSILPTFNSITSQLGPTQIASILNSESQSSSSSASQTASSSMTLNPPTSTIDNPTSVSSSGSSPTSATASSTGNPDDSNMALRNDVFGSTLVKLAVLFCCTSLLTVFL